MAIEERDEKENNLIAAGALFALLAQVQTVNQTLGEVRPLLDNGCATNMIEVEFDFLKSPYRLTVERVDRMKKETKRQAL